MRASSTTSSGTAKKPFYLRTKFLFVLLSFVNLLNFLDRGIIPGATNEINAFIQGDLNTSTPDVYLGLLQSSFIIGYMIGSILFGHLIHHYGRFFLTGTGCSIWIVAVALSGIAGLSGSYAFLVFARVLSGFGEAGLQCAVPPWIQAASPPSERGFWLAIFYTAIPVGTALGYAYSSLMAEDATWTLSFFIEGIIMIPFVMFLFTISKHFPPETLAVEESGNKNAHNTPANDEKTLKGTVTVISGALDSSNETEENGEDDEMEGVVGTRGHHHLTHPSMSEEFFHVMDKTLFLAYTAAYAAQTAALIGVSTFGSAFLMGLGFFNKESEASTVFGALISVAGIIATPIGGMLLDKVLARGSPADRGHYSAVDNDSSAQSGVGDADRRTHLTPLLNDSEMGEAFSNVDSDTGRRVSVHRESTAMDDDDDDRDFAEREDHPVVVHEHISRLSLLLCYCSLAGALLLSSVYFVRNAGLFLTLVTFGSGFIFLCNSAINMGVMLSVPMRHRSFAIALNVVFLHAFGDVPSPVIVGLVKDSLAPGCSTGDDDAIAASDACRDDAQGLRVTMLLTTLWLLWTAFFSWVAWFLNKQHILRVSAHCPMCCKSSHDKDDHTHCNKSLIDGDVEDTRSVASKKSRRNVDERASLAAVTETINDLYAHEHCEHDVVDEHSDCADISAQAFRGNVIGTVESRSQSRSRSNSPHSGSESNGATMRRSSSRSRIVSADDFKTADLQTQRRSVERLKRISRESERDGESTLVRDTSAEALYNKFREIEDSIEI